MENSLLPPLANLLLQIMTETKEFARAQQRLIEAWGEMASRWGVSKTMAQIYALLFSSPRPLDTDTIMQMLEISRGNANMNLHKLQDWQLVRKVEVEDQRRDFFTAEKDVWRLTEFIIRERKRLEINPVGDALNDINTLLVIDEQTREPRQLTPQEVEFSRQLREMGEFIQLFEEFTALVLPMMQKRDTQQLKNLLSILPN